MNFTGTFKPVFWATAVISRFFAHISLSTQTGPAITDYRSDVRLEHLGLIVEKAMEDYVKRIKKVE